MHVEDSLGSSGPTVTDHFNHHGLGRVLGIEPGSSARAAGAPYWLSHLSGPISSCDYRKGKRGCSAFRSELSAATFVLKLVKKP